MLVETFELEEVAEQPPELEAEAVALIEKLGLDGQQTRIPYRKMTEEETFVYGILCPMRTPLKKYKEGPIPLRVLQVAAHATDVGMLDRKSVV